MQISMFFLHPDKKVNNYTEPKKAEKIRECKNKKKKTAQSKLRPMFTET